MAKGYKLRLPDGSEIGPMDLQAVKDWHTQGLVGKNDAVLKPGAKTWSKVGDVLELQDLRTGKRAAAPPPAPVARRRPPPQTAAEKEVEDVPSGRVQAWRTVVAGILFVLGAGGAAYFIRMPERWHPGLDGTPWQEIALGQLLLGLLLVRGWDLGRRIVRIVVFVLGFAAFPVFGILIAQGLRGRPLGAVACVWVLASGFFALLSGARLSWLGSTLSLLLVVAGYGGVGYLGFVPEKPAERLVQEWSAPDRRFVDATSGLTLLLPADWRALRPGQTAVAAPATARFVFAQPRRDGFGFVVVQTPLRGVRSLDEYLKRVIAERTQATPAWKETGRSESDVGRVKGYAVDAAWEAGGVRFLERTLAWRDGWTYASLSAWIADDGTAAPKKELSLVIDGLSQGGAGAARLEQALGEVTREVPHLTPRVAELVMGESESGVIPPEQAFRRAYELAARGLPGLTAAEGRELGELSAAAAAILPRKERSRLDDYFVRVRGRVLTTPEEDREMARLMKAGVSKLSPERLARLQALYDKAIRVAIGA